MSCRSQFKFIFIDNSSPRKIISEKIFWVNLSLDIQSFVISINPTNVKIIGCFLEPLHTVLKKENKQKNHINSFFYSIKQEKYIFIYFDDYDQI